MIIAAALALSVPQTPVSTDCPVSVATATKADHQKHGKGLWIGGVAFTGDDIASATVARDQVTDETTVDIRFTPSGHAKFRSAQRCRLNRRVEIWLDNELLSSPYLMIMIEGPGVVVTGNFTTASAAAFAARISQLKP